MPSAKRRVSQKVGSLRAFLEKRKPSGTHDPAAPDCESREIALRIIRACAELDVETVAVFSDATRTRRTSRRRPSVAIGRAPSDSYLSIPTLVDAARAHVPDAVIRLWLSLREQRFCLGMRGRRLLFVGPPSDVIARMGSKIHARQLMQSAGVPSCPANTTRPNRRGASEPTRVWACPRSSSPRLVASKGHARVAIVPTQRAIRAASVRLWQPLRRHALIEHLVDALDTSSADFWRTIMAASRTSSNASAPCSGAIKR